MQRNRGWGIRNRVPRGCRTIDLRPICGDSVHLRAINAIGDDSNHSKNQAEDTTPISSKEPSSVTFDATGPVDLSSVDVIN